MSKLTEQLDSLGIVSMGSSFLGSKSTDSFAPPAECDVSDPHAVMSVPTDSFELGSFARSDVALVPVILRRSNPQVASLAIQPIMVFMVNFDTGVDHIQNKAVKVDGFPVLSPHGVNVLNEPIFAAINKSVPFECGNTLKVGIIDERNIAFGQRDSLHSFQYWNFGQARV